MEWWVRIARWFLFCFRFSRFYQIYHLKTLATIPSIHVYIIRINNRLVFRIKDGHKLALWMPETMKLCGSTKKLTEKTHQVLKVVDVVLSNVI